MYTLSHQNSLTTQNRIPLSNLTLRSSKCVNKDDPKKPKQKRGSLILIHGTEPALWRLKLIVSLEGIR